MTVLKNSDVECHLCPLKFRCKWQQSDISYKDSRFVYRNNNDAWQDYIPNKKELKLRSIATQNCPIRIMVED